MVEVGVNKDGKAMSEAKDVQTMTKVGNSENGREMVNGKTVAEVEVSIIKY